MRTQSPINQQQAAANLTGKLEFHADFANRNRQTVQQNQIEWNALITGPLSKTQNKLPRFVNINPWRATAFLLLLIPIGFALLQAVSQSGQALSILQGWGMAPTIILAGAALVFLAYTMVYGTPILSRCLRWLQNNSTAQREYDALVKKSLAFLQRQDHLGDAAAVSATLMTDIQMRYQKHHMGELRAKVAQEREFFKNEMGVDAINALLNEGTAVDELYAQIPEVIVAHGDLSVQGQERASVQAFLTSIYQPFTAQSNANLNQSVSTYLAQTGFKRVMLTAMTVFKDWMSYNRKGQGADRHQRRQVFHQLQDALAAARDQERQYLLAGLFDLRHRQPGSSIDELSASRCGRYNILFERLRTQYEFTDAQITELLKVNLSLVWHQYYYDQKTTWQALHDPQYRLDSEARARQHLRYQTAKRINHDRKANPQSDQENAMAFGNVMGWLNGLFANSLTACCGGVAAAEIYALLFHINFSAGFDVGTVCLAAAFMIAGAVAALVLTRPLTQKICARTTGWWQRRAQEQRVKQAEDVKNPKLLAAQESTGRPDGGTPPSSPGPVDADASLWERAKHSIASAAQAAVESLKRAFYSVQFRTLCGVATGIGACAMATYSGAHIMGRLGLLFGKASLGHITVLNRVLMGFDGLLTLVCAGSFYIYFCVSGEGCGKQAPAEAAKRVREQQGGWQWGTWLLRQGVLLLMAGIQAAVMVFDGLSLLPVHGLALKAPLGILLGIFVFYTMYNVFEVSYQKLSTLWAKPLAVDGDVVTTVAANQIQPNAHGGAPRQQQTLPVQPAVVSPAADAEAPHANTPPPTLAPPPPQHAGVRVDGEEDAAATQPVVARDEHEASPPDAPVVQSPATTDGQSSLPEGGSPYAVDRPASRSSEVYVAGLAAATSDSENTDVTNSIFSPGSTSVASPGSAFSPVNRSTSSSQSGSPERVIAADAVVARLFSRAGSSVSARSSVSSGAGNGSGGSPSLLKHLVAFRSLHETNSAGIRASSGATPPLVRSCSVVGFANGSTGAPAGQLLSPDTRQRAQSLPNPTKPPARLMPGIGIFDLRLP